MLKNLIIAVAIYLSGRFVYQRFPEWKQAYIERDLCGPGHHLTGNPPPEGLSYQCRLHNGVNDGIERHYLPDGTLAREFHWKLGVRHGLSREFHKDGSVAREILWQQGNSIQGPWVLNNTPTRRHQ